MKKLIALLLGALLLCGCAAAVGAEGNVYTAGLYKFTLPDSANVSAEKEIAEGIHAFVAKADDKAYEVIGLTVDYKAENPLAMPEGQDADDVHFANLLQMVLDTGVGDVKEAENGRLRYAQIAVESSNNAKMIAYSRLDQDAGFLLLIAWKQEGKSDQTVERTMTILDAAKSAELLARPAEGLVGKMIRITAFPTAQLREKPEMGSQSLTQLNYDERYPCIGEEGDYYKIKCHEELVGYIHKTFAEPVN